VCHEIGSDSVEAAEADIWSTGHPGLSVDHSMEKVTTPVILLVPGAAGMSHVTSDDEVLDSVRTVAGRASFEDVHRYQLHLVTSGTSVTVINRSLTALRFLFTVAAGIAHKNEFAVQRLLQDHFNLDSADTISQG